MIKVHGTTAYTSFVNGVMEIVDIADPANPVPLSMFAIPRDSRVLDFEMNGQYGFAAIGDRDVIIDHAGLRVYDMVDPTNPVEVGMIQEGIQFVQFEIRGDLMYALGGFMEWEPTHIYTLDISDPTAPGILGSTPLTLQGVSLGDGLTVADGKAYVAGFEGGLQIYDLSDPTTPALLSHFTEIPLPFDVKVVGDHAFVTSSRGGGDGSLFSVDVSDPTSPVIDDVWGGFEGLMSLEIEGSTAYAIKMDGNGLERALVFDVADPMSIQLIGSSETIYSDIAVSNNTLYGFGPQTTGFDTDIRIEIVDVSNSCNPSCAADMNNDGDLNFFDVSSFLGAFSAGDLMADFTGDGQLNFFDVSAFLAAFGSGCP